MLVFPGTHVQVPVPCVSLAPRCDSVENPSPGLPRPVGPAHLGDKANMTDYRFLEGPGRPRLSFGVDLPQSAARGRVFLVHGYADHASRYDHVVAAWRDQGLAIARLDLRGHGRSAGVRGHVAAFDEYVSDVERWISHLESVDGWASERAPVLFGHSMGGLIATHVALRGSGRFSGLALTSPFFGLAKPVPKIQLWLASVASRITPGLRQPSGLKGSDMSHDPNVVARYDSDPLGFHHVTARWFTETSRAQTEAFQNANRITLPLFCIAAGDDRVVSVDATRRLFDRVGSREKELDVRPGLFHEVLNEPDWREHARRLGERMLRWSGA